MLKSEYESKKASFATARFRAEYDDPYIEAEIARFELVVRKLTSEDPDDIYSRYKGFLFSSAID